MGNYLEDRLDREAVTATILKLTETPIVVDSTDDVLQVCPQLSVAIIKGLIGLATTGNTETNGKRKGSLLSTPPIYLKGMTGLVELLPVGVFHTSKPVLHLRHLPWDGEKFGAQMADELFQFTNLSSTCAGQWVSAYWGEVLEDPPSEGKVVWAFLDPDQDPKDQRLTRANFRLFSSVGIVENTAAISNARDSSSENSPLTINLCGGCWSPVGNIGVCVNPQCRTVFLIDRDLSSLVLDPSGVPLPSELLQFARKCGFGPRA